MAKQVNKLNALAVKQETSPGLYADGNGLYLQVAKGGSKSWVFRYKIAGKSRYMGLGSAVDVGLAQARKAAGEARALKRQGIDPIAARGQQKTATVVELTCPTFADCTAEYIEAQAHSWKNAKHSQQWVNTLATYCKPINNLPVDAVDLPGVLACLKPIWSSKTETASRVRMRIERVLGYAKVLGYRSGENPAAWRDNLDQVLPAASKLKAVKHHSALPYAELPAFMADLRQREGVAAQALIFTILTAARTSETTGATWSEVCDDIWRIPAARMKSGRDHTVPLSKPALAILRQMEQLNLGEYVFPGQRKGRPLSNMAMANVLKRMDRGDITVHGMRSTFRDWTAEETHTPNIVAEMALAHSIKDGAEAAYRRGDLLDKRRQLMDAWARYCVPV